jgi:hypothetical protein
MFSLISSLPSPFSADMLRPGSKVSSVLCRCPTPRRRAYGPYGVRLRPSTCPCRHRHPRGLPVLVQEVSRRVWGLRLRRTNPELALALRAMLPSAWSDSVGVLIANFRSSIPSPPIPLFTLRRAPRDAQRKTRGRVDRYSLLAGIFHPLLPAGLSRRYQTFLPKVCATLASASASSRSRAGTNGSSSTKTC